MIYLVLFLTFSKIGFFTVGGGYAMIPLTRAEIQMHENWLTDAEFADILAISEMTPGPIAVNSATFVGYRIAGIPGAAAATLGVAMPSLALLLLVSGIFFKYRRHPLKLIMFHYVRPVVSGLLVGAALLVARNAVLTNPDVAVADMAGAINWRCMLIFSLSLVILLRVKINPIAVIVLSGVLGFLLLHTDDISAVPAATNVDVVSPGPGALEHSSAADPAPEHDARVWPATAGGLM